MATSKKISEMDTLSSSYISSSYMYFPVVQPDNTSTPANFRLSYDELKTRLGSDFGLDNGPTYTPPAMYSFVVNTGSAPPGFGDDYSGHTPTQLMPQYFVDFNSSTNWFTLEARGVYKVSVVALFQATDGSSIQNWPQGFSEFGTYLQGASLMGDTDFNAIPAYATRSVHSRYSGTGSGYSMRKSVTVTDEYFIDFSSFGFPSSMGQFRVNSFFAATSGGNRPDYSMCVTISKLS